MKRTAVIVAAITVFGLALSTAYVGGDSQASAANAYVTRVGHHGHYGHHHGLRYGYSLRPYVGYHHGWGHGYWHRYPTSRVYGYGVYGYPHRTYYRAPYVVSPHYGHGHGYSCFW